MKSFWREKWESVRQKIHFALYASKDSHWEMVYCGTLPFNSEAILFDLETSGRTKVFLSWVHVPNHCDFPTFFVFRSSSGRVAIARLRRHFVEMGIPLPMFHWDAKVLRLRFISPYSPVREKLIISAFRVPFGNTEIELTIVFNSIKPSIDFHLP
ncbi:hypothetical protein [Achromobacter spanius]|uniref:hypothetical protein n=1 Tax=Achromobacter spanius TaxID=217203 RepID=UPI001319F80F|nr:hypothetical protein [Achromobacter spanius]